MREFEVIESAGVPIKAWVKGVELEDAARQQLINVAGLPFVHKHIAVMPDVHWGMGATIGSVIPTLAAIIPAAVGVDIGCGMMAVKTSLTASHLPDNLHEIRSEIERLVPHGRTNNGAQGDRGAWHDLPDKQASDWSSVFSDRYKKIGMYWFKVVIFISPRSIIQPFVFAFFLGHFLRFLILTPNTVYQKKNPRYDRNNQPNSTPIHFSPNRIAGGSKPLRHGAALFSREAWTCSAALRPYGTDRQHLSQSMPTGLRRF